MKTLRQNRVVSGQRGPFFKRKDASSKTFFPGCSGFIQRAPDEETEKPPATGPATTLPAGFTCTPQPVSHAEFVKQGKALNFDPAGAFGITVLQGNNILIPAVQLDGSKRVMETTAAAAAFSYFIKKNELYPDENGKKAAGASSTTCVDDVIHYLITPGGATKIEEGENEHCSDFQYAFDTTLAKYEKEINKLAKSRRRFKDLDAVNKLLERKTGKHPDDWPDHFLCLVRRTRSRDRKDHKPPPLMNAKPYPTDRNCKFPVVRIEAATFPDIGITPSKNIVQGC